MYIHAIQIDDRGNGDQAGNIERKYLERELERNTWQFGSTNSGKSHAPRILIELHIIVAGVIAQWRLILLNKHYSI